MCALCSAMLPKRPPLLTWPGEPLYATPALLVARRALLGLLANRPEL